MVLLNKQVCMLNVVNGVKLQEMLSIFENWHRKETRAMWTNSDRQKMWIKPVEMPGIEPGAFHMRSERSTTELHPHHESNLEK